MGKIIRSIIGGTWLKVKSCYNEKLFWIHVKTPDAIEQHSNYKIVDKECYSHCTIDQQSIPS